MCIKTSIILCRVCMNTGRGIPLYPESEVATKFQLCTKLQIADNDNLPKALCNKCVKRLNDAYDFRKEAETTDKNFRGLDEEVRQSVQSKKRQEDVLYATVNDRLVKTLAQPIVKEPVRPSIKTRSQNKLKEPKNTKSLDAVCNEVKTDSSNSVNSFDSNYPQRIHGTAIDNLLPQDIIAFEGLDVKLSESDILLTEGSNGHNQINKSHETTAFEVLGNEMDLGSSNCMNSQYSQKIRVTAIDNLLPQDTIAFKEPVTLSQSNILLTKEPFLAPNKANGRNQDYESHDTKTAEIHDNEVEMDSPNFVKSMKSNYPQRIRVTTFDSLLTQDTILFQEQNVNLSQNNIDVEDFLPQTIIKQEQLSEQVDKKQLMNQLYSGISGLPLELHERTGTNSSLPMNTLTELPQQNITGLSDFNLSNSFEQDSLDIKVEEIEGTPKVLELVEVKKEIEENEEADMEDNKLVIVYTIEELDNNYTNCEEILDDSDRFGLVTRSGLVVANQKMAPNIYRCKKCSKTFPTKRGYKKHLMFPYNCVKCKTCGVHVRNNYLKQHEQKCGTNSKEQQLQNKMLLSTEGKHKCQQCDQAFPTRARAQIHMQYRNHFRPKKPTIK